MDANAPSDAFRWHRYGHTYPYANSDSNPNAYADSHADADSHAYGDPNSDSNSDRYTRTFRDSD
jgi:hypothetical protein